MDGPRPYDDPALDQIYNLLFADDPAAFTAAAEGRLAPLADERPHRAALAAIAADEAVESRLRIVAFRRLRESGDGPQATDDSPLLGVVVEVALPEGLDTLAAYADGGVRYVNRGGGMSVIEPGPLLEQVHGLLASARPVVATIGPWQDERLPPPPPGNVRLTFLVGADLYFGQGPTDAIAADLLAGPVLTAATELLTAVVELSTAGR